MRTERIDDERTAGVQAAEYLNGLRRRWPMLVLIPLIAMAAAVAVTLSQTEKYDATAKILLEDEDPAATLLDRSPQSGSRDPEREVNTSVALIKLEGIADAVREELELRTSPRSLLDRVSTEVEGNSSIVAITARHESPEQAARIANSFADEYAAFRRRSARAGLNEAAELARARVAQLDADEIDSEEGRELQAKLRELEIAAAAQTGGVEIVKRADVPTAAATPRPAITGAIALALGLLLAIALALLLQLGDRRLRDEDDVEETLGVAILASIPRPRRRRGTLAPGDDSGQREGYSGLATNLRYFELGPDVNTVMVTSPSPQEGKTNVTLGVARALAALDLRVMAIEADLRRPTFSEHGFGDGRRGLSTILAGMSELEDELVEVSVRELAPAGPERLGTDATFSVLPAGPVPPNPQALIARPTMDKVLQQARAHADVVLVDVPPIGTVNDAVLLAPLVDGIVVMARLNRTRRDEARRALRVLQNLETRVLGAVVTDVPISANGYYGAYYRAGAHEDEPPVATERYAP